MKKRNVYYYFEHLKNVELFVFLMRIIHFFKVFDILFLTLNSKKETKSDKG